MREKTENELDKDRIIELEAKLNAWYSIFGTTQLTHAQARLEVAEEGVKRLTQKLSAIKSELRKGMIKLVNQEIDSGWTAHDFQDILNKQVLEAIEKL